MLFLWKEKIGLAFLKTFGKIDFVIGMLEKSVANIVKAMTGKSKSDGSFREYPVGARIQIPLSEYVPELLPQRHKSSRVRRVRPI